MHAPNQWIFLDQYGDAWFRVATHDGPRVVMPTKYVEELKNLPREVLSFTKANSDAGVRTMTSFLYLTLAKESLGAVYRRPSHKPSSH